MTELNWLKFSDIKARYERIATFENDKEQQFIVKVNGYDKAVVNKYTKNLRANFEVVSGELRQTLKSENHMNEEDTEEPSFPEVDVEQASNKEIEVSIELTKIQDIESPSIFNFRIDQDISEGETLNPDTRPVCGQSQVKATIKVESGRIRINIIRILASGQRENIPSLSREYGTGTFYLNEGVDSNFCYTLNIIGREPRGSRYSINGSWRDA
ncbi:MAG: hypothetical protein KME40_28495 [Komarekiella atlantica HA4396-MV6]|jgi:hypothetical protein|nr:hypothetical protein [Komarekiella atlantica HA4396-MV6]